MKSLSNLKFVRNLTIAFCCVTFAASLMASPLSDAKDAGLVKELPTGYVTSQGNVSTNIEALVKDINQRRKAAYGKIAKQHGVDADQVGRESYAKRHPGK